MNTQIDRELAASFAARTIKEHTMNTPQFAIGEIVETTQEFNAEFPTIPMVYDIIKDVSHTFVKINDVTHKVVQTALIEDITATVEPSHAIMRVSVQYLQAARPITPEQFFHMAGGDLCD